MSNEIFKLKELSAKLGNDLSLIQASGGNTSIKLDRLFLDRFIDSSFGY